MHSLRQQQGHCSTFLGKNQGETVKSNIKSSCRERRAHFLFPMPLAVFFEPVFALSSPGTRGFTVWRSEARKFWKSVRPRSRQMIIKISCFLRPPCIQFSHYTVFSMAPGEPPLQIQMLHLPVFTVRDGCLSLIS